MNASPARPAPKTASDAGSGTAVVLNVSNSKSVRYRTVIPLLKRPPNATASNEVNGV